MGLMGYVVVFGMGRGGGRPGGGGGDRGGGGGGAHLLGPCIRC